MEIEKSQDEEDKVTKKIKVDINQQMKQNYQDTRQLTRQINKKIQDMRYDITQLQGQFISSSIYQEDSEKDEMEFIFMKRIKENLSTCTKKSFLTKSQNPTILVKQFLNFDETNQYIKENEKAEEELRQLEHKVNKNMKQIFKKRKEYMNNLFDQQMMDQILKLRNIQIQ